MKVIKKFREEYYFLSNFYPDAFMVFEGLSFLNSEAAYQAEKCANKEDKLKFTTLLADEAKKLGQTIECREDWEEYKLLAMKKVIYAKFVQNPNLAALLLETADAILEEGNDWGDLFWGVDLETGEGENHLGKLLMELRDYFRENGI